MCMMTTSLCFDFLVNIDNTIVIVPALVSCVALLRDRMRACVCAHTILEAMSESCVCGPTCDINFEPPYCLSFRASVLC